ncbi:hypothetical protein C4J85_3931 [Pseudomonas sp. R4-34-07]|uniref:hypothetical protein n=1 Tax=unclassified Pseudomonas TaxID=196821 RepID=UPI000F6B608A|nr:MULTISPECIES: hypothetical protein [unclassified Pseudomonas]AZF38679.1 hypothetical protein C4J88_3915 [Pseudomonas sp. R4-39-08]AZF54399.1 hypothetical protein C4J85_3931 [Pseudomonas sp. R4-34-07]
MNNPPESPQQKDPKEALKPNHSDIVEMLQMPEERIEFSPDRATIVHRPLQN